MSDEPTARPASANERAVPATLALVIPTRNEAANIAPLAARLAAALEGVAWEAVFVDDDSADGTAQAVAMLARADPRIRLLRRLGRRGLASAVIEGALATTAPVLAVIDADLQHDETILPAMLAKLSAGEAELVVASRYAPGGGAQGLDPSRQALSRWATRLSRLVARSTLTDPMSGYFMVTRDAFEAAMRRLSGQGYKILLDLLASSPRPLRTAEVAYAQRPRASGESKLDAAVLWEFGLLLIDKSLGRVLPLRFILFAAVGGAGVLVHMAVLTALYGGRLLGFALAQTAAALVAMTFNFFLNNALTYRDVRLRGLAALARGLLTFIAVCSVGLVANVGVANVLFADRAAWWASGLAGVFVGAVWNYAASAIFTWRAR